MPSVSPEFPSSRCATRVEVACRVFTACLVVSGVGSPSLLSGAEPTTPVPAARITFEEHVRPILKVACFHCHGEHDAAKGGLDLRLVHLMRKGGRSGPALPPAPGSESGAVSNADALASVDVSTSLLWQRIATDEMPKSDRKLSSAEKAVLRRWIESGAPTARPEPEDPAAARFTLEELGHWAFQPLPAEIPVPPVADDAESVAGPIDAFVLDRLAGRGLGFSPLADRRTLLRRASFDVCGLPPDPEAVEDFVEDPSPDAWVRAVDRLLASPAFGVRFGRHWLDVAGFAESDGGTSERDPERPHAWRFRDWTIAALNDGKPIDAFLCEQLAGDELLRAEAVRAGVASGDGKTLELDPDDPRQLALLTATGFLRMAPDGTSTENTLAARNEAAAAAVEVVSTSLLGLTVNCARCHDHKYDPISIDDYYAFRAIFDPSFPLERWQRPEERLVDVTPASVRAERERIEADARKLEEAWNAKRHAEAARIQSERLDLVPADVREEVRLAAETGENERTERQKELLEAYPMIKPVAFVAGFLVEYDNALFQRLEKEKAAIGELRATRPPERLVMATMERPGVVPASRIFFRGNPESPTEEVRPAELRALAQNGRELELTVSTAAASTSGRRLAYARHLTDGEHPLTARVFVNRVWQRLLGRGLVATPGDFGLGGARPSHPALLDWLARDFVQSGWDLRRLCRQILLSTTYRQRSERRPELDRIDPENELLGRANLRRLEAEAIRDAILQVTGELDRAIGGPSTGVLEDSEGKAVIDAGHAGARRRSVYVATQRRLPLDMLATFDQPTMSPSCDTRQHTTVALQALWFLNDGAILSWTEKLAERLIARESDATRRLERLHLELFSTPPSADELATCHAFLDAQRERMRASVDAGDPALLERRTLASLVQVLLASNRFLHIE